MDDSGILLCFFIKSVRENCLILHVIAHSLEINTVSVSSRRIEGYSNVKELLKDDSDELFIVDFDAIKEGKYNFKLYTEFSKFFQITVMNFPRRQGDLIDSMISGCENVVLGGRIRDSDISSFIEITENLVMFDMDKFAIFSSLGGNMFLTRRNVMYPYKKIYTYGPSLGLPREIILRNFPEDRFMESLDFQGQ